MRSILHLIVCIHVLTGTAHAFAQQIIQYVPESNRVSAYQLVINHTIKDANDNPLTKSAIKTFTVIPADRTSPIPTSWHITPPSQNTLEPLILEFDEPLDHALLHRMIAIKNQSDQSLKGSITIKNQETQWHFVPKSPWAPGTYTLHINPLLEDLAGNQLTRLFDMDVEQAAPTIEIQESIVRTFQITK